MCFASICLLTQFYLFIFSSRHRPRAILHHFISILVVRIPYYRRRRRHNHNSKKPVVRVVEGEREKKSWWNGTNGFWTLRLVHIENHSFCVFHFGYDLLTRNWIVSCSMFMCRRNRVVSFIVFHSILYIKYGIILCTMCGLNDLTIQRGRRRRRQRMKSDELELHLVSW